MSRKGILTIVMVICAGVVIASILFAVRGFVNVMGESYDNEDKYTAGETDITETVKNLDINWINGKVTFARHSGRTIELREKSAKEIDEDMKLRWWLDGDTLRVQFAESGFHMFAWNPQEKELTITLPEDLSFSDVHVSATSGDLEIPSLTAENLDLEVTSGDINASAKAARIRVDSTSGDTVLQSEGEAEEIVVESTSGDISVEAEEADRVKVRSTSGGIGVTGGTVKELMTGSTSGSHYYEIKEAGSMSAESTSGGITIRLDKFDSLKVDATSGDVTAALPEKPGFTAELETTSGDVDYSLPMSSDGSTYVCGDGSGSVDISTTSGDVQIHSI